jgi:hypothetical protein
MARTKIAGTVVGLPICISPATAGLTFSAKHRGKVLRFRVAGKLVPGQSPNSAKAMASLLVSAFLTKSQVLVVYDTDPDLMVKGRYVALEVGLPAGPFGPYPKMRRRRLSLTNPLAGTVFSVGVIDYNQGAGRSYLQTNIDYGAPNTAFFETSNQRGIPGYAWTLAFAYAGKLPVEVQYQQDIGNRQIARIALWGSAPRPTARKFRKPR